MDTSRSAVRRSRVPASPRRAFKRHGTLICALLLVGAPFATAQLLSDLEPERPLAVEDARPVSYRAFSASADWTHNARRDVDDYGPGFSVNYGAARGLEVGAAVRWVTSPDRNAQIGVSSGDLRLHALFGIAAETERFPAVAFRVGVEFPTGLDSRGTDLELAALATRSFDTFRLHGNLKWRRRGGGLATERSDRFEGIVGIDLVPGERTNTLLLADASLRSNPVRAGSAILKLEAGLRQRVGLQTLVFLGAGSELSGDPGRARLRLRAGFTHLF